MNVDRRHGNLVYTGRCHMHTSTRYLIERAGFEGSDVILPHNGGRS